MTEIADFGTVVLIVAAGLVLGLLVTVVTSRVLSPRPASFWSLPR